MHWYGELKRFNSSLDDKCNLLDNMSRKGSKRWPSFVSSESVVVHTGTAASEKMTLVQALHHGCITLVGENKKRPFG